MDGLAMQSTERDDSEQAATALELRRKRAAVLAGAAERRARTAADGRRAEDRGDAEAALVSRPSEAAAHRPEADGNRLGTHASAVRFVARRRRDKVKLS